MNRTELDQLSQNAEMARAEVDELFQGKNIGTRNLYAVHDWLSATVHELIFGTGTTVSHLIIELYSYRVKSGKPRDVLPPEIGRRLNYYLRLLSDIKHNDPKYLTGDESGGLKDFCNHLSKSAKNEVSRH